MSGTVIRVIEDSNYDFADLQTNGLQSILIAQRIDVSQYREGGLLVRVVKLDIATPAKDDILIAVYEDCWDPFSGTTLYSPTVSDGDVASAPYPLLPTSLNPTAGTTPPTGAYGLWFPLTTPFGGLLQLGIRGTRTAGTPGDSLSVQLNADLILKD